MNSPSQVSISELDIPRHGTVTLFGYGIDVRVNRGHLLIEDGIAGDRRRARIPRVGHGLKRLVVIGSDGMVSLAALRWLADQDAAFVMLERDGSVLATTGPVRPSDARLRRAQALALQSGVALGITRELIGQKLAGQAHITRKTLLDETTARKIEQVTSEVPSARSIDALRLLESQGAAAYWSAWRDLPIMFPKEDAAKIPKHWSVFGTRKSPLTGSPRLAANPANAILNYLYAVLESETRLAVTALGLDPGIAFFHTDTPARDSLACDVMEPIRPQLDDFLLSWITREPLKRSWFFEQRNGSCRLMSDLAVQLSKTSALWARAVAPLAEWVVREIWASSRTKTSISAPPTRLTQNSKRAAKGKPALPLEIRAPKRENLCRGCGKTIRVGGLHCAKCFVPEAAKRISMAATLGRIAAKSTAARAKHIASRRRTAQAISDWDKSAQPAWLTKEVYSQKIQPLLEGIPTSAIRSQIGVSRWYAGRLRKGYRPHPRHWYALAVLVGMPQMPGGVTHP
jgi:CRISPR-associated endonuclease Cas1